MFSHMKTLKNDPIFSTLSDFFEVIILNLSANFWCLKIEKSSFNWLKRFVKSIQCKIY